MQKLTKKIPDSCPRVQLPRFADDRGSLAFGEGLKHIPFEIKRVFWTYNIKDANMRGDHAHRTCEMVLFPIGGSFDIEIEDGECCDTLHMDDPSCGVYIPPLVWCRLKNFTPDAACISLASEVYSAEDYIHDYEEFKKLVGR